MSKAEHELSNFPLGYLKEGRSVCTLSSQRLLFQGESLYWNPAFREIQLENTQHLLISDHDFLFVPSDDCTLLENALCNPNWEAGFVTQVFASFIIRQLIKKQILLKSQAKCTYFTPVIPEEQQWINNLSGPYLSLTQRAGGAELIDSLSSLIQPHEQLILICLDDFLDPRLKQVADELQRRQRSWVPIQFRSNEIFIGPYFDSDCRAQFQGFYQSILSNRPVSKWCFEEFGEIPSVPQKEEVNVSKTALESAAKVINEQFSQEVRDKLFSIDLKTFRAKPHYVPWLSIGRSTKEMERKEDIDEIIVSKEGGFRTQKPDNTLAKLCKRVSHLTGLIQSLKDLTPNESEFKIYKAAYLRSPRKKQIESHSDFICYSLGKGISENQSKVSALGEAIERKSCQYDGTEEWLHGKPCQLPLPALMPHTLKPYSDQQYLDFDQLENDKFAVKRYTKDDCLHWVLAQSLVAEVQVYIPFTFVYGNTPFNDEKYIRFNSNGAAAGNTLEEAILQGFLEVVERDAIAIWWYNRIERFRVDLSSYECSSISRIGKKLDKEWEYWVLDIQTDLPVPVFAAIAKHRSTAQFRFGFGAHLIPEIAIERSLTELFQLIVVASNTSRERFDFNAIVEEPFLIGKQPPRPMFISHIHDECSTIIDYLDQCKLFTKEHGLEIIFVETTKFPELLRTVKVVVPGLCFIWPEFGNQRLFSLPVKLGWLKEAKCEANLNPIPLFV